MKISFQTVISGQNNVLNFNLPNKRRMIIQNFGLKLPYPYNGSAFNEHIFSFDIIQHTNEIPLFPKPESITNRLKPIHEPTITKV